MNWLIKKCKESNLFANVFFIVGIILILLIAFLKL
jgi:hypothetical protein